MLCFILIYLILKGYCIFNGKRLKHMIRGLILNPAPNIPDKKMTE